MASLTELPNLVGFFSYSRNDDEGMNKWHARRYWPHSCLLQYGCPQFAESGCRMHCG
jgi:hypothetical protein